MKTLYIVGAGTAGLIAALVARQKFPYANIGILKSKDVGIIGVGEGSTEHWIRFCNFVNIPISDFVRNTGSTFKVGVLFKDWLYKGHEYCHAINTPPDTYSLLGKAELYRRLHLNSKSKFKLTNLFEKYYRKHNFPLFPNSKIDESIFQLHFDTFKLNTFLTNVCDERNIKIIDTFIEDVVFDENGYVDYLTSSAGVNFKADFYIDCSGFRRVLTNKSLKFKSYIKQLPMNHAIAFPTEHDQDNYEIYTSCTALSSGWAWKIPTQERYGNGYVFDDNFISADQAVEEITKHIGKDIQIGRDIKFEAGRLEKFWYKNVLSIGLSSGFTEPLEAQSIGFSILQSMGFLDYIEGWFNNNEYVSEQYNRYFTEAFDNIVSFVQLHYLTSRKDSEFWRNLNLELTDFNKNTLEIFKRGDIDPIYFESSPYLMFKSLNFFQVYSGLDLIDKRVLHESFKNNTPEFNNFWEQVSIDYFKEDNYYFVSHKQLIDIIKNHYSVVINQNIEQISYVD